MRASSWARVIFPSERVAVAALQVASENPSAGPMARMRGCGLRSW